MSDRPLWSLTRARFYEYVREPGAVFWTFGFPVLLAVGLGIAFREQPTEAVRVLVEGEGAAVERAREILSNADDIRVLTTIGHDAQIALRRGAADVQVTADDAGYVYRFDPTRPEARQARLVVDRALQSGHGRIDAAPARDAPLSERGGRYIDFLIPGLIGLNMMSAAMWGIGYVVVEERSDRRLKRLAATPMRRSHYLLSFMLSRSVFIALQVAALLLVGWLGFDVIVQGGAVGLVAILAAGALCFAGMSLLVAGRAQSVEVASGWMNVTMLPMWVLSGSFFSYERFPEWSHPLLRALPLTAINDGLRHIMNEGRGLPAVLPELAVLATWGAACFTLALRTFRWK